MIYERQGDWHRIARITGPHHNLLGLMVEQGRRTRLLVIEPLPAQADVSLADGRIRASDVLREVEDGVSGANHEHGTNFQVSGVQFVPDDTPNEGVYRMLAHALIRRIAESERGWDGVAAAGT